MAVKQQYSTYPIMNIPPESAPWLVPTTTSLDFL